MHMAVDNGILKPSGVIQLRGGTKQVLHEVNPLLASREIVIETDTGRLKAGDGIHRWNELPYAGVPPPPDDGKAYVIRNGQWQAVQELTVETHFITAEEITAQAFRLFHSVAEGYEERVLLFASGVAQAAGKDFLASGKVISWKGLGLADVELEAGEIFLVQYMKG